MVVSGLGSGNFVVILADVAARGLDVIIGLIAVVVTIFGLKFGPGRSSGKASSKQVPLTQRRSEILITDIFSSSVNARMFTIALPFVLLGAVSFHEIRLLTNCSVSNERSVSFLIRTSTSTSP